MKTQFHFCPKCKRPWTFKRGIGNDESRYHFAINRNRGATPATCWECDEHEFIRETLAPEVSQ